jgi:hypothetical protein
MSICEKTITLIFLDLELVHHFINRKLVIQSQYIFKANPTPANFILLLLVTGYVLSTTTSTSKLKSKACYDWQSVSQYVLVSSPLWNLWPDVVFCLKVAVLSLWGALSDERSGLSPVSHIVHVTCFMYMQYILDLCQHRLSRADHAPSPVAYTITAV